MNLSAEKPAAAVWPYVSESVRLISPVPGGLYPPADHHFPSEIFRAPVHAERRPAYRDPEWTSRHWKLHPFSVQTQLFFSERQVRYIPAELFSLPVCRRSMVSEYLELPEPPHQDVRAHPVSQKGKNRGLSPLDQRKKAQFFLSVPFCGPDRAVWLPVPVFAVLPP